MDSTKQIGLSLYYKFRNLILYGIIGLFSAGIDFIIYYTMTSILDVFYLIANIFSISIGISISFVLNKKFNFKVNDNVLKRFLIFITVGFGGLLTSSALLYYFIDILDLDKILAKLLSIAFVVLIQFFVNKFITFKKYNYEQ